MKKFYSIAIILLVITHLGLDAQTLIAKYPLLANGTDSTGNNTDMSISKAEFKNGGAYSNGIYYGNDTTGTYLATPQIEGFNFDDLTIKVEFLIEEHPEHIMPIIMAGSSWRWLSAWMDGDKIALKVNNGSFYEVSDVTVALDQWNSVSISYNKADGKAMLHLNDVLVVIIDVEETVNNGNARITNSDGGSGRAYKGYWRNLEMHNASIVSKVDYNFLDKLSIIPFGNQVQVDVPFDDNGVSFQMFDISGRNIGENELNPGRTVLTVPKGNSIILFVLTDQKGNRLVKKLAFNN